MRRPVGSELNSLFNSARFSASSRPLTVKTTSPFAALVILSIFSLKEIPARASHTLLRDGNHRSNWKVLKMLELAASEMSENSAIAESSYNTRDWIWSRLSDVRVLLAESQRLSCS